MDTLKEWTRFKFDFLEQVEGDLDLPPSAFKVAFRILQHCNMKLESGFAGIAHIASKTGLRKETVLDAVRRLVANGHFEIDPGQPGRGHSHIYTPILKGPETGPIVAEEKVRKPDLSVTRDVTNKRSGFSSEKVRFSEIKGPVFRGKGPETGPEHLLTPSGTPSLNTVRSGTAPASENDREKGDRGNVHPHGHRPLEASLQASQGAGGRTSSRLLYRQPSRNRRHLPAAQANPVPDRQQIANGLATVQQ